MDDSFGAVYGLIGVFALGFLALLAILRPVFVYSGQKYAYKCFKELQKMNKKLDRLG